MHFGQAMNTDAFGQSNEYRCLCAKQRTQMTLDEDMNTDVFDIGMNTGAFGQSNEYSCLRAKQLIPL